MNTIIKVALHSIASSLALGAAFVVVLLPALAQAPTSQPRPGPGGPASHSELLIVTPQGKADAEKQEAALKASNDLIISGEQLLDAKQFAAAETAFRGALSLRPDIPFPYPGLAEALYAQGRVGEALNIYRILFTYPNTLSSTVSETRSQMGYAIALSQAGQWKEAVYIYEKALPETTHFGDAPTINVHFDPSVPMPAQLQALAYVATGLQYTGHGETRSAYTQYENAFRSDPNSAFANYYYGYGWQRLDPKDKAKIMDEQQAKAALRKAVKLGKGDVKKAAQKALRMAMKTK